MNNVIAVLTVVVLIIVRVLRNDDKKFKSYLNGIEIYTKKDEARALVAITIGIPTIIMLIVMVL